MIVREERIGDCRLLQGDCMEIMPTLDPVDAVVTDPPYGIGISSNPVRQKHQKKNWDDAPIEDCAVGLILKSASEHIIWGGNYFTLPPSRGFLVWDKKQPENFSLAMCEMAWFSRDCNAKIFPHSVTSYAKQHPTQKPVQLMRWCLEFLPDASTILDPFAGSGSTGVAAVQCGKRFIGIERDPEYFEIMCRRIDEACRQPADLFVAPPAAPIQEELL